MGALICPETQEIWRYDAEPTFILDGHMVFGSADGRILNDFGITPGVRFGINSLQSGQAIRLPTVRCVRSLVHIKAANMLDHPSRREKSCKFGFRFTYDALKDCFMTFHVYAMLPNTGIRNRNKKIIERSVFQSPVYTLTAGRDCVFDSHATALHLPSDQLPGFAHVNKFISPSIFDVIVIIARTAEQLNVNEPTPSADQGKSFRMPLIRLPSNTYHRSGSVRPTSEPMAPIPDTPGPDQSLYYASLATEQPAIGPADDFVSKQIFYCKLSKPSVLAFQAIKPVSVVASSSGHRRRHGQGATAGQSAEVAPAEAGDLAVEMTAVGIVSPSTHKKSRSKDKDKEKDKYEKKHKGRYVKPPTYTLLEQVANGEGVLATSIPEEGKKASNDADAVMAMDQDEVLGADPQPAPSAAPVAAPAVDPTTGAVLAPPSSSPGGTPFQQGSIVVDIVKHKYVLPSGTMFQTLQVFGLPKSIMKKAAAAAQEKKASLYPIEEKNTVMVTSTGGGEGLVLGGGGRRSPEIPAVPAAPDAAAVPAAASSNEEDHEECMICLSAGRDSVLFPCRHSCMCIDCAVKCAANNQKCPTCREPIKLMLQLIV